MKTLVVIRKSDHEWISRVFGNLHPLMLPLCNKPLVEYLIDFAILAGTSGVRITGDTPLTEVERYCESGSRWGIDISYANIRSDDTLMRVIEKNQRFCSNERLLIISGLLFINYSKKNDYQGVVDALPPGEFGRCSGGSISVTGTPDKETGAAASPALSIASIDSVPSYFDLSREILCKRSTDYVLPGYNNEADCLIGMNVMIAKGAEIHKPCIIGNNVQIHLGAVIGPNTVIGSNVIIDRESTIADSIVMDDTYIGENLDIIRKIVAGNLLIAPDGSAAIAMKDPHLLTGIKQNGSAGAIMKTAIHAFLALLLIIALTIPYILLCPALTFQGKWLNKRKICFTDSTGRTAQLSFATITRSGMFGAFAAALSLDRFMLLPEVLKGRLSLIGSRPMEATSDIPEASSMTGSYRPAVFSYAEAEDWPAQGIDCDIVNQYHTIHGNAMKDISMTMRAFINRIHQS